MNKALSLLRAVRKALGRARDAARGSFGAVLWGVGIPVMLASAATGQTLGKMAETAAKDLELVTGFLAIAFYTVGVVLCGAGLLKWRRFSEHSQQGSLGGAFVTIFIGVLLIVAPAAINAVAGSMGVGSGDLAKPKF